MAAGVALAPRGCGFSQSCSQCHDPEIRKMWGCDEPTREPQFWIEPCPHCNGKNQDCECKGSNRMPVHRCPNAMATARDFDVLRSAVLTGESGVLPDAGGWNDQAATYVEAYPIARTEIAHWRAVAEKKAMGK